MTWTTSPKPPWLCEGQETLSRGCNVPFFGAPAAPWADSRSCGLLILLGGRHSGRIDPLRPLVLSLDGGGLTFLTYLLVWRGPRSREAVSSENRESANRRFVTSAVPAAFVGAIATFLCISVYAITHFYEIDLGSF